MRAATQRLNFTVKTLEALDPPEAGRIAIYDTSVRELGLRVDFRGRKSFFWFRQVAGRPTFKSLGAFPSTSVEAARARARKRSTDLDKMKDSNFEGANLFERPRGAVATLQSVFEHYVENHLKSNAKDPTKATSYARWQFGRYLGVWRNRPLSAITREMVRNLHQEIRVKHGGPTANRSITFLRTIFGHAIHPDVALWRGTNPCAQPKKFLVTEVSRDRTIKNEEAPAFWEALTAEPDKDLRDFLLLALSTGQRKMKVLEMKWEHIDSQHAVWVIPDPKGRKNVKALTVPLTKLALSVLKGRERVDGSPWVFPSDTSTSGHRINLYKRWKEFKKNAALIDLHFHDLRRTLTTEQGNTRASTEAIQATLGHVDNSEATRIYVRTARSDETRDAMDVAMRSLLAAGKVTKKKVLKAGPATTGA